MNRLFFGISILLWGIAQQATAQTPEQLCVMLSADISQPGKIALGWKPDPDAVYYSVSRKKTDEKIWQKLADSLPATQNSFTDEAIQKGIAYEYQVLKTGKINQEMYLASGYIAAGREILPVEKVRKTMLVIDESFKNTLAEEIARFENDLKNEGWKIIKTYAPRTEKFDGKEVAKVRKAVREEFLKAPGELQSVVLIGRVAVPYSGYINPDGHNEHRGAWPADAYYGDLDNYWTDKDVQTQSDRPENRNIGSDGKFDQSFFETDVDVAVGRIDLYNMPAFKKTELELLKSYFQRNHDFRTGALQIPERGMIDDNFGPFLNRMKDISNEDTRYIESFASNGWRNFGALTGAGNTIAGKYLPILDTAQYLWSYGCGGGGYQGVGGIGETENFAASRINTIFTMLFGSYFGDWDVVNNVLRAPLCSSPGALVSIWAGRPHWFFHRMAIGETIGAAEVLSQNSSGRDDGQAYLSTSKYDSETPGGRWFNNNARGTFMSVIGDPTLVAQPLKRTVAFKKLEVFKSVGEVDLQWEADGENAPAGYFVYRASAPSGPFIRLNDEVLKSNSFKDTFAPSGENYYKISAVALQASASATYYTAIADTLTDMIVGVENEENPFKKPEIFPNPARDVVAITAVRDGFSTIEIYNVSGEKVFSEKAFLKASEKFSININNLPSGNYVCRIISAGETYTERFSVVR